MLSVGEKRRLTSDLWQSTVASCWTVPSGRVIVVKQVDTTNNKVLVNNVWEYAPKIERMTEAVGDDERPTP